MSGFIGEITSSECARGDHNGCLRDVRHMPSTMPSTGAHLVCECDCHDSHDTQRKPAPDKGTKAVK